MFKTKVNRQELLTVLKKNRENHRGIFLKAQEKYREKAIAEFQKKLERVRNGDPFDQYIHIPIPEEHTEDYDRVIAMLEMQTSTSNYDVELDEKDFAQFVQDDWGWKKAFAANTTSYVE